MLHLVNDIPGAKGLPLRTGTVVDATLIAAPGLTKNFDGQRDPETKETKKGKQWYVGMKANIGVDAHSGLVHTVAGRAANPSQYAGRCDGSALQSFDCAFRQARATFASSEAGWQGRP